MTPTVDSKAPDFSLPDQDGKTHKLSDSKGKWTLLYFYPKDDTPGCTVEACTIRDNWGAFKKAGIVVLGVSVDTVAKHKKFADKYELPFTLLADEEKTVVNEYGVWGKKKFMGREFMGVLRTTFIIGRDGRVKHVMDKVKTKSHHDDVMALITQLGL